MGGSAEVTLGRIEKLLAAVTVAESSVAVILKAAHRALHKKAPCHHDNKLSAGRHRHRDLFRGRPGGRGGERFAFVTRNHSDFSLANGNHQLPHADLAAGFSRIKSMYFINLSSAYGASTCSWSVS